MRFVVQLRYRFQRNRHPPSGCHKQVREHKPVRARQDLSPKYLDADTNDRRKCGTGESQQSMKIRVQSYDDAPFFSSVV